MVFIVIVTALYMFTKQDQGKNMYKPCKLETLSKQETITKEIIKEIVKKSDEEKEKDIEETEIKVLLKWIMKTR